MMQKLKNLVILPISILLIVVSCTKTNTTSTDTSGNWVKRSEFDGNVRTGAISFTIADTAYIGTGFDGTIRYNDLWAYDANKNYWIQRATMPGIARNSAVGFTVGTKAYVTTGFDGINKLTDTWEFNPATNSWTQKTDFAGTARYSAVAFGIGSNGFVTTGFDGGYTKDMWEFTPNAGTNGLGKWTQLPSFGGTKRSGAVCFVSNNKGYVLTGINNGTPVNDFWVFDPSNTSAPWTQLRDISNTSTQTYDEVMQ
jgi:N-acetylneuraminic acid mutarotase